MLKINDVFWTIQGEGHHSGRRALFVRMPFCNLQCPWCDTSFNTFKEWSEEEFVEYALREPARFAVITGGEPTKNAQTPSIVRLLKGLGFEIAIETNGHYPIPKEINFVTVSPKKFHEKPYYVCIDAMLKANEFKYVVDEGFDFSILNRHTLNDGKIYSLSPEFNRFEKSIDEIVKYIQDNPQWRISLQTHKWMKLP